MAGVHIEIKIFRFCNFSNKQIGNFEKNNWYYE